MSFMEDTQILSLFGDEASLWGQLPDGEGDLHLGSGLESHLKETKLTSGLESTGPNSPQSDVSDDPLPDWMSQKVSLSAWLGDEEDIPMAELMTIPSSPTPKSMPPLPAEELFKELLVDIGVPPTSPSPGEDQSAEALLALSPASSISAPGSPTILQESMAQQPFEPTSPMVSGVEAPAPVGDLEEQAMALLDAMGCMDFTANQDLSGTQVITITLPVTQDQMSIQVHDQQHLSPPDSPSSIDSSMPASPEESPIPSPRPASSRRMRSKPKLKNTSPIEKKSRKRDQNKHAATRYRVKKKIETDHLTTELNALEDTNKSLKNKAEGLEKEIKYLKDLLIEVRLLKGTINTIKT